MKKIFLLLSIVLITFIGCKKDENPTGPNPTGGGNTNPTGQPIPTFTQENNGVLATLQYKQNIMGFPVEFKMAYASLGQNGKDAGNVYVNTTQLSKVQMAGATYYMSPYMNSPEPNINFNGQVHRWEVEGNSSNGISGFSIDVVSPNYFRINTPAANATVSKSSGFSVTWQGGTNARVMISLVSQTNGSQVNKIDLNDNGSFNITSQDLSNFPTGKANLYVVKYRYSIKDAGGKNYIAVSEIIEVIEVNVN